MSSGHVEEMLRAHGDEILNLREFDKRHIPCQPMGSSIKVQQVPQSQPLPVINGAAEQVVLKPQQVRLAHIPEPQQPVQSFPAPPPVQNGEPFQNTQLVRSTYTYEPAQRVFHPPQVAFQPTTTTIGQVPAPQPPQATFTHVGQPSRPVSYQPVSSVPATTTTTFSSQPGHYTSIPPPATTTVVDSSSGVRGAGLPNDLLSRIDKQLQQSKNQFPS